MDKTTKVTLGILALVVLGLAIFIPPTVSKWKAQNARFDEAMRNRKPQAGEQGAEMRAAMEDLRRAVPQPTPEEQAKVQAMTQSAPGGVSLMDLVFTAESVKTWPQPQKDAALQAALQQLANPDPEIRLMAVEVLGRMGDSRAIPQVFNLQQDTNGKVRTATRRTLIALGYQVP